MDLLFQIDIDIEPPQYPSRVPWVSPRAGGASWRRNPPKQMATVPAIGRADPAEPLRLVPDAAGATKDLYERYGRQIYRFCLRELGSREEAEGASQTTFLNAFLGLDRGGAPEF